MVSFLANFATRNLFSRPKQISPRGRHDYNRPIPQQTLYSQIGSLYTGYMRIIKRSVIREFGARHPQARNALDHWYQIVRKAEWLGTADIKRDFGNSVDFVMNNRAVFDVKGNDYRLIAEINYRRQAVFIRFMGTHAEYSKINADTVKIH
jgi:mRNA interferase HigB